MQTDTEIINISLLSTVIIVEFGFEITHFAWKNPLTLGWELGINCPLLIYPIGLIFILHAWIVRKYFV